MVSRVHVCTAMLNVCVVFMVVLSTFMAIIVSMVMLRMNYTDWNCYSLTMRIPGVDEEVLKSFMKNNFFVYLEGLKNNLYLEYKKHPLHSSLE